MRNLEIKCPCESLETAAVRAVRLGARDAGVLVQRDTFFPCARGRLKLREFGDGTGELIAYLRPDTAGVRASDYRIHPVSDPESLSALLSEALGPGRVVRKTRRLFLFRNTRIHLDDVEGLGTFLELETVIVRQSQEEARAELDLVAAALELPTAGFLAAAYVDLLERAP